MEPLIPLYGGYSAPLTGELLVAVVVLFVLSFVRDRLRFIPGRARSYLSKPGPSAIEQLQSEYERGEIDLAEFEERAELALDDRAAVIVDQLETVDGVGPERAAAVADEFENVEAVRRADVDDLTDVHGVGQETAEKIQGAVYPPG